MKRTWWLMTVGALMALWAPQAQGWIITQVDPDPAAGFAGAVPLRFDTDPNVDIYEILKFFIRDPNSETMPVAVMLRFTREAGDQDTVLIADEWILNLQLVDNRTWKDFHVVLINEPNVTLRGDAVVFTNPGGARATQQTGGAPRLGNVPISATSSQIDWQTADPNQWIPPGGFSSAPTNQLILRGLIIDVSDLQVGESFVLKEWPTIPEPGALALLAVGGLAVFLRRRRHW